MANLRTTADLLDDALRKAGEKIDGTSDYESDALAYMNNFYRAILSGGNEFDVDLGEPWPWAKAEHPAVLTLEAPYETGTVSLTSGSTSGTFSSAPADSQVGKLLKVSERPEFFRVASHTAGATAFTLDAEYTDDTGSALDYKLYKLDYSLTASVLRQIGPMVCYRTQGGDSDSEGLIYGLDLSAFNKAFPLFALKSGVPTHFAPKYNSNGTITVRFNYSVNEDTRVEYDYIPEPSDLTDSDASIPLIPAAHRQVLSYATAYALCLDKEDSKAEHYFKLTQIKLKSLVGAARKEQQHVSKRRGKLVARLDLMGSNSRWPTED